MTLRDHLREARARLHAAGIPDAESARDASLLARHVLGWDHARLLASEIDEAPEGFAAAFDAVIARRAAREPAAYIRGVQEFYGRDFVVNAAVLIPRPETEFVVEEALACLREPGTPAEPRIVDAGTGSGCLAVTLAFEWPGARVAATELSEDALAVARTNAARLGMGARVDFRHGSGLADIPPPLDLVVANPPYVADHFSEALAPEVGAHEPSVALFGGRDGLRDVREFARQSAERLRPGGWLVMEFGDGQEDGVRGVIADTEGLTLVRVRDDLQGIPRVVVARRE